MLFRRKNKRPPAGKPEAKPREKRVKSVKRAVPAYFRASLTDCVTIEITGFNQVRLLARLADEGISVLGVERGGSRVMRLRVRKKQSEKTFAICESMCYTYSVVAYDGMLACLFANARRAGVAAGALLLAALTFFFSGFVMRIEINDMESIGRLELISYLKESDVGVGSRISALDREEIRSVVNAYDGVAESSVEIRGNTLVINVVERDSSTSGAEKRAAITSLYDARVTRVICAGGTSRVEVGQIVKKGDLLIEGALYNQEGEKMTDVNASGTVYGTVVKTSKYVVSTDAYTYRRTGNKKTVTALGFMGLKIGKNVSPFPFYESETTEATLSSFLPIRVTRTVFYETEAVRESRTPEELAEFYRQKELEEFTAAAENIEASAHVEAIAPGLYGISVYVEAETVISD